MKTEARLWIYQHKLELHSEMSEFIHFYSLLSSSLSNQAR